MSENSYLITLLQKENQTIIAYELNDKGEYTGVSHTESFFAKANSKWKFTVIPDKFHDDYWIHIIQSDHQTITVRDNARFHDYRAGVLVSYPDDDKLTGIQAGDLDSGIYPETNYDVAVEDPHDRYKYLVVNQNCRIFATLARDLYNETDYHTVTIKQVKHQTIIFTYRNKKYYTDTIVENNENYSVEVVPDPGYTATSLIINGNTIDSLKHSGKATEDLTIAAAQTQTNYLEFIFKEFDANVERFNNSDGKLLVGTLQVVAEPEVKPQVYIAKGSSPWYYPLWSNKPHVVTIDESISGQATVTCDSSVTSMNEMFKYCRGLTELDLSNFDTSNVTNMGFMFYYCDNLTRLDLSSFDTSNVTNMGNMFYSCFGLTELDLSSFDTSNVTNMGNMFGYCFSLTSLDLSNFDTSNTTDMHDMFLYCTKLITLNLSNFNTSNVTIMNSMFSYCDILTKLDLSSFDTSNVTDMNQMFLSCSNLASLDLSDFDTSKVTDMGNMFDNCFSLTSLDLSNFDTSNVTTMGYMFYGCYNLTTIKGIIDMKSCKYYEEMFVGCSKLTGVKIKNPPSDFESKTGLTSSQYIIVS